jgi:DUF1365 family protein
MLYLDLRELPDVFRGRWLWSVGRPNVVSFRREDHLGDPDVSLDQAVRDLIEGRVGSRPEGSIRLLTHPRYFGYGFNPVSFYFCFDRNDDQLETIVAEVNNTPWGEQHCYVLDHRGNDDAGTRRHFRMRKQFHVSPFMAMGLTYDWSFSRPGTGLTVQMRSMKGQRTCFDATLMLSRTQLDGASLARVLVQYPFMTGRIVAAIYLHAARLWLKRAPFYVHPRKRDSSIVKRAVHE